MREVKTNLHGQSLTSTHPSPSSNRSFGQRQPGAHWSPHGSGFPRFSQVSGHSVPHDEKTLPLVQLPSVVGGTTAAIFGMAVDRFYIILLVVEGFKHCRSRQSQFLIINLCA